MAQFLDAATGVFRAKGYHATSVADLTEASTVAPGSIYKAFKDKRAVFLAAFDRYVSRRESQRQAAIGKGTTGREKLCEFLTAYAGSASGTEGRRGCLVVGSAMELVSTDPDVAVRVTETMARTEAVLVELIRRGKLDGSVASDVDDRSAARLMLCVLQGMRVVGKVGRSGPDMVAVVAAALRAVN